MQTSTRSRRLAVSCWLLLAFLLAIALQIYLLYMPAEGEGSLPPGVDKLCHAAMFAGPTWLALLLRWRWAPWVFGAYAPLSEVIQGLDLIGRDPDWRDAVADITGVLLACGAIWLGRRRRRPVG